MLDKVAWTFFDEAGNELPEQFLETEGVLSGKPFQVLAQELRVVGTGDQRHFEMHATLRTTRNGAALEEGRRWLVVRAYEVLSDGPGEALTKSGRHLGSKATYAGVRSADAEQAWEHVSAGLLGPPVGS